MILYRLAIDLGTSSIGIAVYEIDERGNVKRLLHLDEVIFGEPVDSKTMTTLCSLRRAQRLARRQIARKAKRLRKIAHVFQALGVTKAQIQALADMDIYALRVRAMREKVTLPELCKVFFYLSKHRGYKGDLSDGDIHKRIDKTEKLLAENEKPLAQLLLERKLAAKKDNAPWYKIDEKGTFIFRKNMVDEFKTIFAKQKEFHPELNADYPIRNENFFPDLKGQKSASLEEIFYSALFFQRPIRWELDTVGKCVLEKNEFCASTGQIAFQRYRIAKKLSDVRVIRKNTAEIRPLSVEEIGKLFDHIRSDYSQYTKNNTISFTKLYGVIDLDKKVFKFNFDGMPSDEARGASIKGMTTERIFKNCQCAEEWESLSEAGREAAIEFLTNVTRYSDIQENTDQNVKEQIKKLLVNLNPAPEAEEEAVRFILALKQKKVFPKPEFTLEHKRASYGLTALKKLTAELLQGKREFEIIDELYPDKGVRNGVLRPVSEVQINNPIIDRALAQLERQLNHITKHFGGNPMEIVIELSREMKNSLEKRQKLEHRNKNSEKKRTAAAVELQDMGVIPHRGNIEKYLLWQELDQNKCPYCGKVTITQSLAFSGAAQVDHIIPQSSGGPNTYSNKVLCCPECNKQKGNRTPYQWAQADNSRIDYEWTEKYAKFLEERKATAKSKKINDAYSSSEIIGKKIFNLTTDLPTEELTQGFADRQNQQTAWIGKIVLDWLKDICKNVNPSFGSLTAYLRTRLGIATVLPEVRLLEGRELYAESGEPIDKKVWEKLFLKHLTLADLVKNSKDETENAVMAELSHRYDAFKAYLTETPNQLDTEEKRFAHFVGQLKNAVETSFDKRCDHRHHMIDAAVIGLCNLRVVQAANRHTANYGSLYKPNENWMPFEYEDLFPGNLREELKKRLLHYVVWHKPDHHPAGEFFQQTAYDVAERVERDSSGGLKTKKRLVKRADINKVFEKGKTYIETVVAEEHTKRLMLEALARGEKQIKINGNIVKKIRVLYKTKSLVEFDPEVDMAVRIAPDKYKYYQNSGYACCDFDAETGKRKQLIPHWQYVKIKKAAVPAGIVRIFAGDMLFDEEKKIFYLVKSFHGEKGLILKEVTEASQNSSSKSINQLKGFRIIRTRADIREIKRKG